MSRARSIAAARAVPALFAVTLLAGVARAAEPMPPPPPPPPVTSSAPVTPAPHPTAAAPAASSGGGAEDGPPDTGFSLGARLGYALPLGSASHASPLNKELSGGIPIVLDGGYRVTPHVYIGLYFQFAPTFVSSDVCPSPASCSAKDIRFGFNARYHVSPKEKMDPWGGVGIGYEWASVSSTAGGRSSDSSLSGFEFLNLQVGIDFKATPRFRVGPMLGLSVAQYSSGSTTSGGTTVSADIQEKTFHEWLFLGLRGQYDL